MPSAAVGASPGRAANAEPLTMGPLTPPLVEPGAGAGRWSGLSWEVVQERYRTLKEQFGGRPPTADASQLSMVPVWAPEGNAGGAGASRHAGVPRPRTATRGRGPATLPRELLIADSDDESSGGSSSSDDDGGDVEAVPRHEDSTLETRRRLKLESERRVLASRGMEDGRTMQTTGLGQAPTSPPPVPVTPPETPPVPVVPVPVCLDDGAMSTWRHFAARASPPPPSQDPATPSDNCVQGPGMMIEQQDPPSSTKSAVPTKDESGSCGCAPTASSASPGRSLAGSGSHAILQLRCSASTGMPPPPSSPPPLLLATRTSPPPLPPVSPSLMQSALAAMPPPSTPSAAKRNMSLSEALALGVVEESAASSRAPARAAAAPSPPAAAAGGRAAYRGAPPASTPGCLHSSASAPALGTSRAQMRKSEPVPRAVMPMPPRGGGSRRRDTMLKTLPALGTAALQKPRPNHAWTGTGNTQDAGWCTSHDASQSQPPSRGS